MEDIVSQISELEKKISSLPVGYISKKLISGKERYYQQWTENGKIKSKHCAGVTLSDRFNSSRRN